MANFSIKTDLLKIKGAFVTNLKGKTGVTKRCLIIPVDESGMFLGEKGCYLNMTAIEMREARYGDTHCVKVSLPKEQYEAMSEEERSNTPILGGMHVIEAKQMAVNGQLDSAQAIENEDDLPF
jgi:hypothetical protein|nr:MAG TPA: hypothetical protein [Caudoviricetes sp.]